MRPKILIRYDYVVHPISEDGQPAYKAVIPAFSAVVYGESLTEIEQGVALSIQEEVKQRRRRKQYVPEPESSARYSGKFVVRLGPAAHERLTLEAKTKKKSLNSYVKEKLLA